ncbi:MAG: hypothetical protein ABI640_02050 [Gammaproteobacteria bacterium]
MSTSTVRRPAAHLLAWSVFVIAACGSAAHAAKEVVPDLQIGMGTETNPRLASSVAGASSRSHGTVVDVAADFSSFSDRSSVSFTPELIANRYSGATDSDIESNDIYLNGKGERRWLTGSTGFDLDFSRVNVLRAELVPVDSDGNPDTNDPPPVDSGRLAVISDDRTREYVRPYVTFQASPRGTFTIAATKYKVSYSGSNLSNRTGFDDTQISFGLTRNVSTRNVFTTTVALENYSAEVNNNDTDAVRVEAGLTRQMNPLWTLTFAGGLMRDKFMFVAASQQVTGSDSNVTARLGLRKRSQRSAINFDVLRDVGPSSNGFSSLRDEVRIYYNRELTQRLKTTVGVLTSHTQTVGNVSVADTRDYRRAELNFEWAIRPKLFAGFGYTFTSQEFKEDPTGLHDTHAIFAGIRYRGMSRH